MKGKHDRDPSDHPDALDAMPVDELRKHFDMAYGPSKAREIYDSITEYRQHPERGSLWWQAKWNGEWWTLCRTDMYDDVAVGATPERMKREMKELSGPLGVRLHKPRQGEYPTLSFVMNYTDG